ncbi:MAG: four helix bundle protein [Ignavibacteriales bacterium]|nr:four helix bundle protein [Ignavibacteriales bacterium]HPO55904.1 four helix bundle protein [Ignavibacteriaceae bacterium]
MYHSFTEMSVWKNAMKVAETIHHMTDQLPKKEDYGFTSQIRRAALSISANVAEAFGREHTADKINFYYYSRGSVTETQSHLEYGLRVKYITENGFELVNTELIKIYNELNKIIKTLKNS